MPKKQTESEITITQQSQSPLESLFNSTPSVEREIVNELFSNENLDRKTELKHPVSWSIIDVIRQYLKDHQLPYSANILQNFIETSFRYLISKNRKGRAEYVEALKALSKGVESEQTKITKL
jgi:hypothetical protein